MATQAVIKELQQLLANTYGLYLKTQNYHWHVKGAHFSQLHALFEEQYKKLAEIIDEIAERIIILGSQAVATFKSLAQLNKISDGDSNLTWQNMLSDLASDQQKIIENLKETLLIANQHNDEGTAVLISDKIPHFEKQHWFLQNHLA
jgi:starvation-inducible DNA-binding protein